MSTALSEAAVSPDTQWRRLSPRMLLVHPVIELGRALPALAVIFFSGGGSGRGFIWSLVGASIVTAFSLLRWVTTRFRITPEQIQLRRGVLRRTTVAAPLDRVRSVEVTAHLLHRVLGLAKVVIGTGTTDRKGRDRLALDGMSAEAAGRLRAQLLHRGEPPAEALDSTLPPAPVEQEIVRLDRAWVRYAPFTLSGAITGHLYATARFTAPGLSIRRYGEMLQSAAHRAATRFASGRRPKCRMMRGSSAAARVISAFIASSSQGPATSSIAEGGAASRNANTVAAGCL